MTQLNDAQRAILIAAADADDQTTLAPEGESQAARGLIRRGLLISMPQSHGPSRLLITTAGLEAIGVCEDGEANPPAEAAAEPAASKAAKGAKTPKVKAKAVSQAAAAAKPAVKPANKLDTLAALLSRPEGATLEAMQAATGWQAHSVRGALSGSIKKRPGIALLSERTETGRIYRIVSPAGDQG